MKIGPILMSPEMVLANLSGLKTETRRVIKDQPDFDSGIGGGVCDPEYSPDAPYLWRNGHDGSIVRPIKKPPSHLPGDKLYVREAWRTFKVADSTAPKNLKPGHIYMTEADHAIHFKCENEGIRKVTEESFKKNIGKFRQGMHMPRWASRMYLEVTEVHIEKLHQITADGCLREGFPDRGEYSNENSLHAAAVDWYRSLWDGLNKERGFGLETDPWVSVTKYNLVIGNIDEVAA